MSAHSGKKRRLRIGTHVIGHGSPVFIIAELGLNHDGSFRRAQALIRAAKKAGASAVKLQTYITEKRVAAGSPIFEILKHCEISFGDQKRLFEYAESLGLTCFSTPFDEESVDFLADIGAPCFKVASFDIVNGPLLKKVASKGQPVVMSRGMASRKEIDRAVRIMQNREVPFALLHCVSAYPVKLFKDLNLATIGALEERYRAPVGFSDHTIGIKAPELAVAAGALLIEKHFTHSTKAKGPDHSISLDFAGFRAMVALIRAAEDALGSPAWQSVEAEAEILQYRRKK